MLFTCIAQFIRLVLTTSLLLQKRMTLLRNLVLIFIFLPYKLLWQYQFASHFLTALFFDTAVHFI